MSVIFNSMKELASNLHLQIATAHREIESDSLKKYTWTNRVFR